jgi:AbrB family looped-hinge helix DNA binding protein
MKINRNAASNKYMGSVKVGAKGQIVIPKEVRDMFDINPGDSLLLLADSKRGIALERPSVFNRIADAILNGKAREVYPDIEEEDSLLFAKEVKKNLNDENKNE